MGQGVPDCCPRAKCERVWVHASIEVRRRPQGQPGCQVKCYSTNAQSAFVSFGVAWVGRACTLRAAAPGCEAAQATPPSECDTCGMVRAPGCAGCSAEVVQCVVRRRVTATPSALFCSSRVPPASCACMKFGVMYFILVLAGHRGRSRRYPSDVAYYSAGYSLWAGGGAV